MDGGPGTAVEQSAWRERAVDSRAETKLAEPADLYRIPLWVLEKLLYTVAPVPVLLRLATLRGTIDTFVSPLRKEAADAIERHLGGTTEPAERSRILRRHLQYRRRARFARLWPQIRGFADADRVVVEGLHHLDDALAQGNGVVLAATHFGYTRLMKPLLRAQGRNVLLVGQLRPGMPDFPAHLFGLPTFTRVGSFVHTRVLRLPRWSRFDERYRETTGVDLPAGTNIEVLKRLPDAPLADLRPHVAALARNEILIVLADGRQAQTLSPVSVLGVQVDLAPGAVGLARATGARVLPAFVVDTSTADGSIGLQFVIHPPLQVQRTADAASDLAMNLDRFAAVYEAQVRECPADWNWHAVRDGVFNPMLAER